MENQTRIQIAKDWLENIIESSPLSLKFHMSGYEWSKVLMELAEEMEDNT